MSFRVRKTIEASAVDIDIAFEHQQSSLKVNLSYDPSLTDSSNELRKTELLNRVNSNTIKGNKDSSVIICSPVKSLCKRDESPACLGITKDRSKRNGKNILYRSQIVQQRVTKDVTNNVRSDIDKSNVSMEIIHVNDKQNDLISQSTNFVTCSNSESDTPKNVRLRNTRLLQCKNKCKDSESLNSCYMNLIDKNDNKHSDSSTLITKKGHETITVQHENNVRDEYSLADENEHFAVNQPLMCSTFIESSNKLIEQNQQAINSLYNKSTVYIGSETLNLSVPMDLTTLHNTRQIQDNYRPEIILNKVWKNQNVQSFCSTENSMKTVRSSLNVNTSFDSINKENDVVTTKDDSMSIQDVQNALCSPDTSMRVNTSLDNVCQMLRVDNAKNVIPFEQHKQKDKNVVKNDSVSKKGISILSEINLTKEFRNVAVEEQKDVGTNCEARKQELNNDIQNLNGSRNSPGIVQGTPYPISRSVLLKSYLKFNTMTSISNFGLSTRLRDSAATNDVNVTLNADVLNSAKGETVLAPAHASATQIDISNDHAEQTQSNVSLDGETLITAEVSKACDKSVNINRANDTKNNSNVASQIVLPARGKKKLMPLNDDSELFSFTPVDVEPLSPENSKPIQKHRHVKKKLLKQKSAKNIVRKKMNVKQDHRETALNTPLFETDNVNRLKTRKMEPRKQRRVLSKKIVSKKQTANYLLPKIGENDSSQENRMELSRRVSSLDEFESCKTIPLHVRKNRSQDIFIVGTGLSKGDKNLLKKAVNTLGKAKIELCVTNRTTHVVTTGGRTINLLHGIIRGCWLIKLDWVTQSLQNNRWLNPIKYEIRDLSKAVSENRKDRQMFGPSYISDIFTTCGFVHIENNTVPSCEVLQELVTSAGGRITEDSNKAKIVVGKNGLKESWVLDSIISGELQSCTKYQRA